MSEFNIPRALIWPNVVFDTTTDDGMAEARAWVETLLARSDPDERPRPSSIADVVNSWLLLAHATEIAGLAPVWPVEPRTGASSTPTPDDTNRTAQEDA